MRIRNLVLGPLAAGLLAAAPQAQSTELLYVLSLDSASGDVQQYSELCMEEILDLVDNRGFVLAGSSGFPLGGRATGYSYLFVQREAPEQPVTDVVQLQCYKIVNLGGLGKPGKPGGL